MKRVVALVLTLVILMSSFVFADSTYGNVSDWAIPELDSAIANGIVKDISIFSDCQRDITRQEFATIVVNMYKAITGEEPVPAPTGTFFDTSDEDILVAYQLGIINGVGNGLFAPDDAVTRQEMAIMMKRAVDAMGVDYVSGDGVLTVSDAASVASWAVDGVDFAFENGFIKGDGVNFDPLSTTPVEQGAVIINRVFEKYYVAESDDYTQGFEINLDNDGKLTITYDNTGKTYTINNDAKAFEQLKSNPTYVYYHVSSRLYRYNVASGSVDTLWDANNITDDFVLVQGGTYDGYIVIRCDFSSGTQYRVLDNSWDHEYIGDAYSLDNPSYQVEQMYEAMAEAEAEAQFEEDRFKIAVTDSTNYNSTINFTADYMKFYSSAKANDFVEDGTGYLNMWPKEYNNNDYCGPIGVAGDETGLWAFNGYGGTYEVDMKFYQDTGNGGIVFNVVNANDGNDIFTGYYVGVSPETDEVIFGKSYWDWQNIEVVSLGYDLQAGDTITLKVQKNGDDFSVWVDGYLYIDVTHDDDFLNDMDNGGFGIRTWNADVYYSDYTIDQLPY